MTDECWRRIHEAQGNLRRCLDGDIKMVPGNQLMLDIIEALDQMRMEVEALSKDVFFGVGHDE